MVPKTREKFRLKVEKFGGPDAAAFALKCSRSTVDSIIDGSRGGKRGMGVDLAYRIQKVFGIRMQEWVEPVDMETVERVA